MGRQRCTEEIQDGIRRSRKRTEEHENYRKKRKSETGRNKGGEADENLYSGKGSTGGLFKGKSATKKGKGDVSSGNHRKACHLGRELTVLQVAGEMGVEVSSTTPLGVGGGEYWKIRWILTV